MAEIIDPRFKLKTHQIEEILEEYKDAPKQGTEEWFRQRTGIGGSEMAIITGDNKYSTIIDLIRNHTGLSKFEGNIFTQWGCLFEEQIKNIVEIIMDCPIHEIGSVQGSIQHHRYSPDGLATMKLLVGTDQKYKSHANMYQVLTGNEANIKNMTVLHDYVNVLMEFKCPASRIPDGSIPKEYLPQIKSGLCDLLFCDVALFVNAAFRKCSYRDWKPNNIYDKEYHKSDCSKIKAQIVNAKFTKPLAIGGIGLYIPLADTIRNTTIPAMGTQEYNEFSKQQFIWNEIVNRGSYGKEVLLDFGSCATYLFHGLLNLYSKGQILAYYFQPKIYRSELSRVKFLNSQKKGYHVDNIQRFERHKRIDAFKQWCYDKNYKPFGYLPFKLFECDFLIQQRVANFLKSCENKVNEVMKCIHLLQKIENMDERLAALDELTITSMKGNTKKSRRTKKSSKKTYVIPHKLINMLENII